MPSLTHTHTHSPADWAKSAGTPSSLWTDWLSRFPSSQNYAGETREDKSLCKNWTYFKKIKRWGGEKKINVYHHVWICGLRFAQADGRLCNQIHVQCRGGKSGSVVNVFAMPMARKLQQHESQPDSQHRINRVQLARREP